MNHGNSAEPPANRREKKWIRSTTAAETVVRGHGLARRLLATPGHLIGYAALMAGNPKRRSADFEELRLNKELIGYPRNHVYRLHGKQLTPSFSLYRRLRELLPAYPDGLESFLDVSCCRGYFVLDAARRPSCRIAVGIDVHEPFVTVSKHVSGRLGTANTAFYCADLRTISADPESFGGPFQVVLMLNTYHYAYWGSESYPDAFGDHREIMRCLSQICADRLIFSARLEVDRLPSGVRKKGRARAAGPTPTPRVASWRPPRSSLMFARPLPARKTRYW